MYNPNPRVPTMSMPLFKNLNSRRLFCCPCCLVRRDAGNEAGCIGHECQSTTLLTCCTDWIPLIVRNLAAQFKQCQRPLTYEYMHIGCPFDYWHRLISIPWWSPVSSWCSCSLVLSSHVKHAATIAGLWEKLGVGRETVFLCLSMELQNIAGSHDRRQCQAESGYQIWWVPWKAVHAYHVHV